MHNASYNMEEAPPGDEDYSRAGGESGRTRYRFPPAPTFPQQQQREEPHKVKLSPMGPWVKDTRTWFTLAESTFNRHGVTDARLRFDLVLPALPEEVIDQVRGVLHAVDHIPDPYYALKTRLLQIYTPKPLDLCQKIIYGPELGDRTPSSLMDTMLALLPPGEPDGLLFKTLYINRLPMDIRDHVVAAGLNLTSREMAAVADNIWFARCSRQGGNKLPPVAAAVPESNEQLEEAVAALNVQTKRHQPKKKTTKDNKGKDTVCYVHKKYGDQTWKCAAPTTCTWAEN